MSELQLKLKGCFSYVLEEQLLIFLDRKMNIYD